jgi:hypothetical protein
MQKPTGLNGLSVLQTPQIGTIAPGSAAPPYTTGNPYLEHAPNPWKWTSPYSTSSITPFTFQTVHISSITGWLTEVQPRAMSPPDLFMRS